MNKIHCQYAVIGFSLDLTDPNARSVPIAVVGNCETEDNRKFTFLLASTGAAVEDPFARELLGRVPRIIREQIYAGVEKRGVKGWLPWLGDHLTQSLHVSRTGDMSVKASPDDYASFLSAMVQAFETMMTSPFTRAARGIRSATPPPITAFTLEPVPAGYDK
jgi:hypothetical protein